MASLALLDRLLAPLRTMPDLVPGSGAADEREPVPAGAGGVRLGGEDLDDVAVVQGAVQRHQAPVHPGAHAPVTDLGVHRVGEVHRGGLGGQRDDVALGGEHVDLGGVDLEPERLEELAGVGGLALPVQQLPQPGHVVGALAVAAALLDEVVLVLPVRGDAVLGPAVHLERADLELDRLALRTDHRRGSDWYMLNFAIAM
jgi:hypothetical protein